MIKTCATICTTQTEMRQSLCQEKKAKDGTGRFPCICHKNMFIVYSYIYYAHPIKKTSKKRNTWVKPPHHEKKYNSSLPVDHLIEEIHPSYLNRSNGKHD